MQPIGRYALWSTLALASLSPAALAADGAPDLFLLAQIHAAPPPQPGGPIDLDRTGGPSAIAPAPASSSGTMPSAPYPVYSPSGIQSSPRVGGSGGGGACCYDESSNRDDEVSDYERYRRAMEAREARRREAEERDKREAAAKSPRKAATPRVPN
jgi:hypothetical protein